MDGETGGSGPQSRVVREISLDESVALYGLSVVTFLACLFFPFLSTQFIEPYVAGVYGQSAFLGQGNILIMMIMMMVIMLFPLTFLSHGRGVKLVDPYFGGANVKGSPGFSGSGGTLENVTMQNYYMGGVLNEVWLSRVAVAGGAVLLAVMIVFAIL